MQSLQENYLPQFVYGGIDGVITTFAIIAGVVGADLSLRVILVLGFANLFADGLSMAASSYLSSESAHDLKHPDHQRSGLAVPALKNAATTFFAFVLLGVVPLLPFLVSAAFGLSSLTTVLLSAVGAVVTFGLIGIGKAHVTQKSVVRAVTETVTIGGVAAAVAFSIGYLLRGMG